MTSEIVLNNAKIVLADRVLEGHLVVRDGAIAEIGEGRGGAGEDLGGDYLLPGLVELHTDHLEGHFMPRPKVRWNKMASVQAHDAQVAASGITTVFDALRVGMDEDANITAADMREMADTIAVAVDERRLRADHYIHLRCEVSAADVLEGFELMQGNQRLRLASLMDHAPGQRQFISMETYRTYYQGKMKLSDSEFDAFCERRMRQSQENAPRNRPVIAERCRQAGITLASHDDATTEHVREALELGTALAEFPTTAEAAGASAAAGMKVLMGAPNVVRGGSHSGNISALDLHRSGHLDVLSSDYVPFSLMQAVFVLAEREEAGLPAAVRLVTKHPAEVSGLVDRGEIAPKKRADLVRVRAAPEMPPIVRSVWRTGERVA
ncbi:alpha-D-ribose 1-methylphosphonate 5-triphosphate diphosphatase [Aquamicrobium sp. LC103]|uniref:alpha-D-ribose 1-methylphosphonate 5-triphosphate diphosphatase n=1 Tax=Aquamicrobium sp. LC103 TaxID=1120658 RepID=UPI00063EA6D9|nr:alpha-D-ribose 1-methylphosphonate 5-triphosphate diphosphatase [Aquamicrobium sp. LC103]TKT74659.1 alpha-D-ribose 1-methylphosphonate 5-triphosphate diphosphatase [Aquamicrobium sp. LC103]